jgi:hypothetical protein
LPSPWTDITRGTIEQAITHSVDIDTSEGWQRNKSKMLSRLAVRRTLFQLVHMYVGMLPSLAGETTKQDWLRLIRSVATSADRQPLAEKITVNGTRTSGHLRVTALLTVTTISMLERNASRKLFLKASPLAC